MGYVQEYGGYFYFTNLKGIIEMGKPPRNHRELQEWIMTCLLLC